MLLAMGFTEQGIIMVFVLNTRWSVEVGVFVVPTFVKLHELSATHKEHGRNWISWSAKSHGAISSL